MEKIVNWGLIGFGHVVKNNINGLPFNTDNSKIYAFTQRNLKEGYENQKKYNIEKFYTSATDLLQDKNVDIIYICTPPGLHYEFAKLCCRYKKPCYIEKPFCRNFVEAQEIVNLFTQNNIPLWIAHYKRTLPKFKKVKELIDNNLIGRITNVTFVLERKYTPELLNHKWLFNLKLSGGGRFFDIAPHTIDLFVYFFGNVQEIFSIVSNNQQIYKVEDVVSFILKTKSNIIINANFNFVANNRFDCMKIYGTAGTLSFSIEGGGIIELEQNNAKEIISFKDPLVYEKAMVIAINNELLMSKYNDKICHGKDSLETYRIIDCILDKFYSGRNRNFWLP